MKRLTGWVRTRDVTTFFWVNRSWRCAPLNLLMPVITQLGGVLWCIALSVYLLVSPDSYWREVGLHLAIGLLGSSTVVYLFKRFRPRLRPYQALQNVFTGRRPLKDSSFPSGHSTAAFCTAVVLDAAIPAFSLPFYLLASGVALSRVYLGLHYPSDITIGALLGMSTGWLLM